MVESTEADSDLFQTRARAGSTVLSLLASPLCAPILRAHLEEPLRLPELRERIGGPAQTTLRGQVGNLRAVGALERHVRSGMPYTVKNELTELGCGILGVAAAVETWLSRAPQGAIALGSESAKSAIRALVSGWDSAVLSALAVGPLSLTELDDAIADVSYPSLERRISALRVAGQVETVPGGVGAAKPYSVTEWARRAAVPLMAAGQCESAHLTDSLAPLGRRDVETALLLAMPLVEMPEGASGSCLLAIGEDDGEDDGDDEDRAGVRVEIELSEGISCAVYSEEGYTAFVRGGAESWATAISDGRVGGLDVGGDEPELPGRLLQAMRSALS